MAGKAPQSSQRMLTSDSVTKSLQSPLGRGRYAEVWLGRCQGKTCVVKVPRMDVAKQLGKDLEIFNLERLSHPNLVDVMGIWVDPKEPGSPPCVVMEHCEMSLPEYLWANKSALKRSHGSTSPTEIKIRILLNVARGLIFLHQRDVFHGDLRSSNLLIPKESTESEFPLVKISDYGFTQRVNPLTKTRRCEILCDEDFLPPEMLGSHNATLTPQVDVFMFGDVALETATLDPVSRTRKVRETTTNGKIVLTEVERRTESIRKIAQLGDKDAFTSLISSCLAENPEQRLSTCDIEGTLQTHLSYYQGHPYANELQEKTAECERLRAEMSTERKRAKELQRQLNAYEESKIQLKKQSGAIETVKESQTQAELERLNTAQLTIDSLKLADEVSSLTVERDTLQKQVDELKQEMKCRDETIAQLQSQVVSLTADMDRLQTAKSDLSKKRDSLKKQLWAKQDQLSKLKDSSEKERTALFQKMTTFRERLDHERQEVVDLKSVATEGKVSVTKQFVALRAELDVVRKGILHREKASNRAMQDLEVQLKTKFESDTASLKKQVSLLSKDKATLKRDLSKAQDELKVARQSYSSSQGNIQELGKKVSEQGAKIEEQTAMILELESQLNKATVMKALLEDEIVSKAKQKYDRDRSEKEHEAAFQRAIDALQECHHKVFGVKDKADSHPIANTQDVFLVLKNRIDAQWKQFGVFLGVDHFTMKTIEADHKKVSDCLLQLVSQWMAYQSKTGDQPRTWETVAKAVKDTGDGTLAEEIAANLKTLGSS